MDRLAYLIADQQRMSLAKNYFAWQGRLVLPELGQRVLEVGCGIGNFTGMLLNREFVVALDSERECVDLVQKRYGGRGNLQGVVRDAAEGLEDLKKYRPDSCVCLNVLEHVGDDVAALRGMASALPHNGKIVLLVPAFQTLYGPIDRNLGHYRRYTRSSLRRAADAAGLVMRKSRYVNLPGFFGWGMNSHVFRLEANSAAQIEIFDRFLAPVISRVERLIHPPFGQTLFCVLSKGRINE